MFSIAPASLISFAIKGRAAEIEPWRAGVRVPGMGTHDYWLYSFGLIFVTVLVIVA
jgi:hypothetical protein